MIKRDKFSLSHYKLLSARMGYLIPIQLTEVLPGDTFQMATSLFIRLAPMVAPVMHPVHVRVHHWYVPTRLIWEDFEDFITGGPDGLNQSIVPFGISSSFPAGSLPDYMGVPVDQAGLKLCSLPMRAYSLIYNEWYRDQDLEDPIPINLGSGFETQSEIWTLRRVDWERDYFTTARPWPQKGPAVSVPVNLTAAGEPSITAQTTITGNGVPTFLAGANDARYTSALNRADGTSLNVSQGEQNIIGELAWVNPALAATTNINFTAGNPELGSVDINQLREAFALQRFEEHRALYGSRYTEYLRFLGIKASDARLQRPEYLGGGKQTIQFSEVLQTSPSENSPVGAMAGHGVGAMRTNRFRRFFEEHGYVISLMMVQPVAIYQQGLPRMWQRQVKEDYFQRELQHIGQQEVWQSELYATKANSGDADYDGSDRAEHPFGYQNRYDEYRWHESSVSGEFRKLLNYWHMARDFDAPPALNADFISGLPTNRIFAAQENDQLYVMASHSIQARRAMAKFGNPI